MGRSDDVRGGAGDGDPVTRIPASNPQGREQALLRGTGAVEERARLELNMIKNDEVFVQITAPAKGEAAPGPTPAPDNTKKP